MEQAVNHSGKALKQYIIGFVLSIIFSLLPFYVVIATDLSAIWKIVIIFIAAYIQLKVQMILFMHITEGEGANWNIITVSFTVFMVLIIVIGSIWIMFSLDHYAGHDEHNHNTEAMIKETANN